MVTCAFKIDIVKKYPIIICDKIDEIKNTVCHRLYNNQKYDILFKKNDKNVLLVYNFIEKFRKVIG